MSLLLLLSFFFDLVANVDGATTRRLLPTASILPKVQPPAAAPDPSSFMVKCIADLKHVTAKIDHSYTDVQMLDALGHECDFNHEMPLVFEDGFKTTMSCRHFAKELTKARWEYLEKGSDKGYVTVCKNYWQSAHAKPFLPKVHRPPGPTQLQWWWALLIFLSGVFAVYLVNRNNVKSSRRAAEAYADATARILRSGRGWS
ncbi:unnamed protein product [Amoebophrya sp. A25]|nr:unnamed protein product [Amoebophrya sp. A25]|eukprot:GSA25T00014787001.1